MEHLIPSNVCRLCADVKEHVFQIFDEEGYKLAIGIKINKYLQIQVDEKDSLPKNVCWDCFTKLEDCTNFVNNSQNAQITLSQKIFSVYDGDNSLKGENVFPHETIFDPASNLLDFNTVGRVQMDKNDETSGPFECDDLDLGDSGNNCFYNDKSTDCLYQERNKSDERVSNITAENNMNSAESNQRLNSSECNLSSLNSRKKLNKRKCVTPVRYVSVDLLQTRTKRTICRKKKNVSSKKKRAESADEDDYSETESEVFKEKYFDQIPWMCTSCEEKFETLSELQTHHVSYHLQPPRYICPHCYKIYMQYHGFVTHLRKFQCKGDFQCENCPKFFQNKKLLDLHRRMHVENPPFQCSYCERSFKHQSGLYAHSRCHLPDHLKRGFACDECDKYFTTKPNLVAHKKIHIGLKNYICDLCGKRFVQKGNLTAHVLTHSDDKPFTCETCQKEFKTLMQLRKHNNVHSGEKPHQCDICGRTFRERGTLREHYRIHTGAMPFSCEYCGKSFRFKSVLTTHRRQHTGERPYSCEECQHHFTNWPNFNKHMKRRHGINKSRSNRIKLDNIPQNNSISDESADQPELARIEIPSFADTLQAVSLNNDKIVRLFDETADPYIASQQTYNDSVIAQPQNSFSNAYYSIAPLQIIGDMMNSPVHRIHGRRSRKLLGKLVEREEQ